MNTPSLQSNNDQLVYLRALERDDIEHLHKWHNDAELYEKLIGTFHYVNRLMEEEWLKTVQLRSQRDINLAICLQLDNQYIGNIYLRDIDWIARHAEVHMFIGEPDQRGKGYGKAALRCLITYAFQTLGLQRLYLFVLADNSAAIKLYNSCGFVTEGQLRQHAFKQGMLKDVLVMGLCKEMLNC